VADILERDGYSVRAVQEPLTSSGGCGGDARVLDKSTPVYCRSHVTPHDHHGGGKRIRQ